MGTTSYFVNLAQQMLPGDWTTKFGKDIEKFPLQSSGPSCGIFMLMYVLSLITDTPFWYKEKDIPKIRKWWCLTILERFQIEGYGQMFAHWTKEAQALLEGLHEPVYRVLKLQKVEHVVQGKKNGDIVNSAAFRRQAHFRWLDRYIGTGKMGVLMVRSHQTRMVRQKQPVLMLTLCKQAWTREDMYSGENNTKLAN
ncbi:hypothetical protein WMY93_002397 [Mugilogobius chulae]|uniref:Ubiquitin-like protease family profile domain-containing protein n=1 Tax=Mugilogobius chulae TaxID=88201 RepID=A0AAW0PTP4_9GOBI